MLPSLSRVDQKLSLLLAFPYFKAKEAAAIAHAADIRLLIDSGAFTAWKTGRIIDLDDYCNFLEKLPITPWRYFTLDVVGDPAGTRRNYDEMRRRGFKPVPIITRGEDPRALDDYYDTSDLVGIGGLVTRGSQNPTAYLKWIMPKIGKRHVHLLGYSQMKWLKYFRPYSCDSTTWQNAGLYGAPAIYLGHGNIRYLQKEQLQRDGPDPLLVAQFARFGLPFQNLQQQKAWRGTGSLNRWISCSAWAEASNDVERNLGTMIFLACINHEQIRMTYSCHRFLTTGEWTHDYNPNIPWEKGK